MGWYCPRCGHEADAAGTCPRDAEPLAQVSTHDLLGRRLGEYTVLASLGGGSYGAVYRAVHSRSGMLVAIKLLYRPIDDDESKRVLIEARAAAMLSHPNVVQVYDLAMTTDRRPYIVMQLLEGHPLSQLLANQMPIATAVSIANDVLAGLGAAHQRGVIHRDLKPDNIFNTRERCAVIVDFGLAKLVGDPWVPSLTVTGEALGTPHYMAPEQVRGEVADGRADLYAVGCLLFEALAGRPPFQGGATFAIFDAHLHATPPRITELRADVPPAIEAAILRALAKEPGGRFATAAEMQRALAGSPPRRRWWPIAVGCGVALAGITVTAAFVAPTEDTPTTATYPTDVGAATVTIDLPVDARPKQRFAVPPLLPGEPPIDPQLETTLTGLVTLFERGGLPHGDLVKMRCAVQDLYANPPPATPPVMRAFIRRYVKLIDDYRPGFNVAVECSKPEVAAPIPPVARKISTPPPLSDELPVLDGFERALDALHEQLAAGRIPLAAARTMYCDQERQRQDVIEQTGIEVRQVRGYHRRLGVLLESYHPGVTRRACK